MRVSSDEYAEVLQANPGLAGILDDANFSGPSGYRRKCAEVAEKGYEGFAFASQGQGGTMHPIAAE